MKYTILLLVILSIMIVGCENQPTGVVHDPYLGGTEGLQISFIDGAPPEETFDNGKGQFAISMRLKNVGEDLVNPNDGYIEIIGINPKDFNQRSQDDLIKDFEVSLRPAKKNIEGSLLEGGETIIAFPNLKYLPDLHGTDVQTIRADLCYDYTTQTTTKICVKRDLLRGLSTKEVCDVVGEKNPKNSGGPIHITSLKENPIGESAIQVVFNVEHVGKPQNLFFKPGLDSDCDSSIENYNNKHLVYIRVNTMVNERRPQCSGLENADADGAGGYIRLYDGRKRTVTCTVDISDVRSIYEELFNVDLTYKYHQSIEKKIQIKDIS